MQITEERYIRKVMCDRLDRYGVSNNQSRDHQILTNNN